MVYGIYSIKDTVAGSFAELLLFKNDNLAKRYFQEYLKQDKFACDKQLFCLGAYELDTGVITSTAPSFLMGGEVVE